MSNLQYLKDINEYPCSCPYLWSLLHRHKTGYSNDVMPIITEMSKWLDENVSTVHINGNKNYQWSDDTNNIFLTTTLCDRNGNWSRFSTVLRFKFEEDLLAFKIRFGI